MASIPPTQSASDRAPSRFASRPAGYKGLLKPLLFVFSAAALAFAFALLGSEVGEGETRTFDLQMLQRAQSLRGAHPGLVEVMRDLSGLGSTVVLTLFTVATVGYLMLVSKKTTALLVAVSALSGTVLVSVFKALFGRLRPDATYATDVFGGWAFGSAWAMVWLVLARYLGRPQN